MKRAVALRPLSRDHLKALIAAKRLREAIDAEEGARTFLEFWQPEGRHHFRVEEEVLLPGWALVAPVDTAGVARMLEEHLAIRREALRIEAGDASLRELHELGVLLEAHVRFEERQLFPLIEAALGPDLDRLTTAIEAAEAEVDG